MTLRSVVPVERNTVYIAVLLCRHIDCVPCIQIQTAHFLRLNKKKRKLVQTIFVDDGFFNLKLGPVRVDSGLWGFRTNKDKEK